MSPQHKDVRILAVIGLVIGLAAVGWVATQALHSPRPERSAVEVATTRAAANPDPALLRLRQQANEVLTGRPSRLARQMPGASPELVAWLERWEQRSDPARSNDAALADLSRLISVSDLNAWDMTRLCRAMTLLDKSPTVAVVWVEPITLAAERDLALLGTHHADREALAMQISRPCLKTLHRADNHP